MGGLRLLSGAEGNKPPGKRDRMEGGCRGKWVWTSQTERILFMVTELGSAAAYGGVSRTWGVTAGDRGWGGGGEGWSEGPPLPLI